MKAIVVTDRAAGTAGMKLVERPEPQGAALASLSGANYGDVVVQVHASGFTGDELSWPSTWIDRLGRDRTPSPEEFRGIRNKLRQPCLAPIRPRPATYNGHCGDSSSHSTTYHTRGGGR